MTRTVVVSDVGGGDAVARIDVADDEAVVGRQVVEVVVDGWRFELVVEDEQQAILAERATRDRAAGRSDGHVEIRAIIPGRIVGVAVAEGDDVAAGQRVLVVEAMKMQNELRAPRAGTVERIVVGVGATIELGDLLVVLR
ncbi:MAG TPA: acetyl-CoA carboxylase biotin carboxyl carrier protein subunit [Candidatus Limnocylindrales bacterium]